MTKPSLVFDLGARRVWQGDIELDLSPLEYEVMAYLAERAGQVVPFNELWEQIWSGASRCGKLERDTVRAIVKRLRKKLGDNPDEPEYLVTARGVGVRLRRRAVRVL